MSDNENVNKMIDALISQNGSAFQDVFNTEIADRLNDAIDAKKEEIAPSMASEQENPPEDEPEGQSDVDNPAGSDAQEDQ